MAKSDINKLTYSLEELGWIIGFRERLGKLLAKRFKKLAGLPFEDLLEAIKPYRLDPYTAGAFYEELNGEKVVWDGRIRRPKQNLEA